MKKALCILIMLISIVQGAFATEPLLGLWDIPMSYDSYNFMKAIENKKGITMIGDREDYKLFGIPNTSFTYVNDPNLDVVVIGYPASIEYYRHDTKGDFPFSSTTHTVSFEEEHITHSHTASDNSGLKKISDILAGLIAKYGTPRFLGLGYSSESYEVSPYKSNPCNDLSSIMNAIKTHITSGSNMLEVSNAFIHVYLGNVELQCFYHYPHEDEKEDMLSMSVLFYDKVQKPDPDRETVIREEKAYEDTGF